ncbi:UDP-N-acetylglucosamine 1-carboxyvinyltransferase [Candidatus Azambacteria bacterium RIFCSPHIGHO2_02_FULL_52_12]|uniref:UDP-N-acetylglucosamine 1-carboxyvinyltransferase n=1 Tax=Candidatus Azambacteria bacterium RIFCSPLOWO2_01_FULL_46_25 TaxID=1797298 RepID=A0A1F5BVX3_9BACT|nr:MAG: UDP-N-acetylglucosamine 1-carboxyvinyltransferase [Candidatus Azambacteria bacterium RIFCSPHIGHO2_02_FULL_52_12]OGD34755.1 MAG: UDP-N-acetylglucosamine 1-carboxyvinyltransferase [Candidatus Azambacteria bacterium RIFCSPLOWO2_01_FULL_46_25]
MTPSKEKFIIRGGKKLKGTIEALGAKNAALPILVAALLTKDECVIDNIPLIGDVFKMLGILKSIGVEYKFIGKRKLRISAAKLDLKNIDYALVAEIRSSVFLFGVLSTRFKRFALPKPGGCALGARILDPHIDALGEIGVAVVKKNGLYHISKKKVKKRTVVLSEMSVTATENILLSSAVSEGVTEIFGAACEHYVQDVCHFLNAMGARISGIGTHHLTIHGVPKLKGARWSVMPDPIEMGTFIALAAATHSHIVIRGTAPEFIRLELLKFKEANVTLKIRNERMVKSSWGYMLADIEVFPSRLRAVAKTHNMPYPGFSSDLLPIFAVLVTQAKGVSLIHDWMYEGRLKYIDELKRMGADAFICDPHRALITGPTPLEGMDITGFDLRAGAALIIAALVAKGTTTIHSAYQADRGYEKIEERLRKIGANIKRT